MAGIYDKYLACHAAGIFRAEEHRCVGDIAGFDFLVHGGEGVVIGNDFFGLDAFFGGRFGDVFGVPNFRTFKDITGGDAVYANAIATKFKAQPRAKCNSPALVAL